MRIVRVDYGLRCLRMPETTQNMDDKSFINQGRTFNRRSVLWPAKLMINKHEIICQVRNLSLGGACVRIDIPIQVGTDLFLDIASRGIIPSAVCWNSDGGMGLTFQCRPEKIKEMFADRLHILGLDDTAP